MTRVIRHDRDNRSFQEAVRWIRLKVRARPFQGRNGGFDVPHPSDGGSQPSKRALSVFPSENKKCRQWLAYSRGWKAT